MRDSLDLFRKALTLFPLNRSHSIYLYVFLNVSLSFLTICAVATVYICCCCCHKIFLVYNINANCHCCQILIEGDLRADFYNNFLFIYTISCSTILLLQLPSTVAFWQNRMKTTQVPCKNCREEEKTNTHTAETKTNEYFMKNPGSSLTYLAAF